MIIIRIHNGQDGYHQILQTITQYGIKVSPRKLSTYDVGAATIIVESPYNALPLHTGRKVSQHIAAAETIQLIGGFSQPNLLPAVFDKFKEDDGHFYGAYGRRIGDQLTDVVRKLKSDRESRQAVITLWNPLLDNVFPAKRDHPCTISLSYRIFKDKLHAYVVMRSSDAWLGIPYDIFQFTQMQLTIARLLDIEPGQYTHTTWSLHVYEEHMELTHNVYTAQQHVYQPSGLDHGGTYSVHEVRRHATDIAMKSYQDYYTDSERWYFNVLSSY